MHNLSDPVLRVNARDVTTKGAGKYPEIFCTLDSAKRFFCLEKSSGSPAQRHVCIAIATNTTADASHSAIRILDDVGSAEAAGQRGRQLHAVHRKCFLQSFKQTRRCVRVLGLQPRSLLLEFGDALAVRKLVGRVHHALHLGGQVLGQPLGDVSHLMGAATLNPRRFAKHLVNRRAQCLGPVDNEQPVQLGSKSSSDQVIEGL